MSNRAELLARKQKIEQAIDDVLEGGEEFQTRNGRVKMASLSSLRQALAEVTDELAEEENNGRATTVLLQYGGTR